MKPSLWSRLGGTTWLLLLPLGVVGGAALYQLSGSTSPAVDPAVASARAAADGAAAHTHADHGHEHGHAEDAAPVAQAAKRPPAPLNAASLAAVQAFARLRDLPPGDAAIELGRQLEAGITPDNTAGYVQALLTAQNRAVERAAIAALARTADGAVMQQLAGEYGALPPEQRGRILQVLEGAANPAAWQGLAAVADADTSEKRSPVVMSALSGVANIGSVEAVQYLISQLTPGNADFALMALRRVHTPQGLEMIRAAGQGSKDASGLLPGFRDALRQIGTEGK